MFRGELLDARLTEKGIQECTNEQPFLNHQNLHPTILCSPLRRTIETACHMLRSHPKKAEMTLRLTPHLKETTCSADTCPVGAEELADFCGEMTRESGIRIEYGCDSLKRDDWCCDILTDKVYAARLRETFHTMKAKDPSKNFLSALTYDLMKNRKTEDDHQTFARIQVFKEMLRTKLMPELLTGANADKKVLIVGHNIALKCMLGEGMKARSSLGSGIINVSGFKNCHVKPMYFDGRSWLASHNDLKGHSAMRTGLPVSQDEIWSLTKRNNSQLVKWRRTHWSRHSLNGFHNASQAANQLTILNDKKRNFKVAFKIGAQHQICKGVHKAGEAVKTMVL